MQYTCPKNPDHVGVDTVATPKKSPHHIEIVCEACGEHIKWGTHKDVVTINTEKAKAINDAEIENAVLCPMMSGIVIHQAKSEVRPARLRFEGNSCVKERCAWWAEIDNVCAVTSIAFALLETKVGG